MRSPLLDPNSYSHARFFNLVFFRFLHGWGLIEDLRAKRPLSVSDNADNGEVEWKRLAGIFRSAPPSLVSHDVMRTMARVRQIQREKSLASLSLDSACLVFAHSLLDNAAFHYCLSSSFIEPRAWESQIQRRQVSIKQVMRSAAPDLFCQVLAEYLAAEVERYSLTRKIALLLSHCQPPPGWRPSISGFVYEPARLERLDTLRNGIVHGTGYVPQFCLSDEDWQFLLGVGLFMAELMQQKYGLQVGPEHVVPADNQKTDDDRE